MSRARYSDETDNIIREIYPKSGSMACVEAIYDRIGIEYSTEQIASRARKRLHLCRDNVFQAALPQNQKAPPEYEAGEYIGASLILEYLGLAKRGSSGKVQHFYKIKCTHCGKIQRKLQVSIAEAKRKNVKGCSSCTPQLRAASLKEERERRLQWEVDQRQKHIDLMAKMKLSSVALTLSPEFDFYR